MERATYTSKLFLIALALVNKCISAKDTAMTSHVEVSAGVRWRIRKTWTITTCEDSWATQHVCSRICDDLAAY